MLTDIKKVTEKLALCKTKRNEITGIILLIALISSGLFFLWRVWVR